MSCLFTIHIDELVGLEVPKHNWWNVLWILVFLLYYRYMSLRFWKCPLIFRGDGTNVPSFLNPWQNTASNRRCFDIIDVYISLIGTN